MLRLFDQIVPLPVAIVYRNDKIRNDAGGSDGNGTNSQPQESAEECRRALGHKVAHGGLRGTRRAEGHWGTRRV